ncbi:hypothetical protein TRFO_30271 [Tritrichomonas foetus]|uniref:Uncharacterized protein n=1 Tax=Tritrichomonas foetus TaxID=1144522 RepID=A0A1J4JTV0_9EUKA|nr:hypothetical protein TRFO_30271 [Tritrichomonas foetus]|eukprot:OHT02545.1 hypothetical protein TRFO_30271 [Tritrichomonas foetus]
MEGVDHEVELANLQKLMENLRIQIEERPEIQPEVNMYLSNLLHSLQDNVTMSSVEQINAEESESIQLILNKFGNLRQSELVNITKKLSDQAQIRISRDILRNKELMIKWIELNISQLAPFIAAMNADSQ